MWRTRGEKTSDFPFKTGLFHRIHKHYYNYPYLLIFFSFFRCAEEKTSYSLPFPLPKIPKKKKREKKKRKRKKRESPLAAKKQKRGKMCAAKIRKPKEKNSQVLFL